MAFLSSFSWSHWSLPSDDHLGCVSVDGMVGAIPRLGSGKLISMISEPSSLERGETKQGEKRVGFRNILVDG